MTCKLNLILTNVYKVECYTTSSYLHVDIEESCVYLLNNEDMHKGFKDNVQNWSAKFH